MYENESETNQDTLDKVIEKFPDYTHPSYDEVFWK